MQREQSGGHASMKATHAENSDTAEQVSEGQANTVHMGVRPDTECPDLPTEIDVKPNIQELEKKGTGYPSHQTCTPPYSNSAFSNEQEVVAAKQQALHGVYSLFHGWEESKRLRDADQRTIELQAEELRKLRNELDETKQREETLRMENEKQKESEKERERKEEEGREREREYENALRVLQVENEQLIRAAEEARATTVTEAGTPGTINDQNAHVAPQKRNSSLEAGVETLLGVVEREEMQEMRRKLERKMDQKEKEIATLQESPGKRKKKQRITRQKFPESKGTLRSTETAGERVETSHPGEKRNGGTGRSERETQGTGVTSQHSDSVEGEKHGIARRIFFF
eukprot:comp61838_c0_seq1/m.47903 comp61838_c0_seq1/g.47903  ORF comp61838_c0_seq1/g.47903 comp61838_c0_seq1/m.47903 type:complete len:343 (-) comp61838_c0_seq1:706-1734(-)